MTKEIKETNDVEKFEERHPVADLPVAPNAVVLTAMQKGYTPEFIEKMMDLQIKLEERESKKAFVKAMADFKKKPLEILKDKKVSFQTSKGKTEYDHASLANVVNTISAELGNHGLSASWETDQTSGIKVTCILTHSGGHSEKVSLTAEPDTSGVKNQIQAIASTVSYLERYTLLAITGLTTKDMDNDGQEAAGGEISLLEQWGIKCDEAGTAATAVDEIAKWWKTNSPAIKKELSKADSALIFQKVVAHKNRLKVPEREPEREPGQEG